MTSRCNTAWSLRSESKRLCLLFVTEVNSNIFVSACKVIWNHVWSKIFTLAHTSNMTSASLEVYDRVSEWLINLPQLLKARGHLCASICTWFCHDTFAIARPQLAIDDDRKCRYTLNGSCHDDEKDSWKRAAVTFAPNRSSLGGENSPFTKEG